MAIKFELMFQPVRFRNRILSRQARKRTRPVDPKGIFTGRDPEGGILIYYKEWIALPMALFLKDVQEMCTPMALFL